MKGISEATLILSSIKLLSLASGFIFTKGHFLIQKGFAIPRNQGLLSPLCADSIGISTRKLNLTQKIRKILGLQQFLVKTATAIGYAVIPEFYDHMRAGWT